jgi:hypothetical protein
MTARTALRRIATGTAVILRSLGWAGEWSETLARWFIAALVASLAAVTVAVHPWLAPVAILGWAAAAGTAAGTEQTDEPEDQDDEPADDEQLLDAETFAEIVHAAARGANVHLTAIRARLIEETGHDWDVLALCRTHGIPTKPVRVPGADPAVTTGIHRHNLPPLPRPLPAPGGVVAAGQPDNNNTGTPAQPYPDGVTWVPDMMRKASR